MLSVFLVTLLYQMENIRMFYLLRLLLVTGPWKILVCEDLLVLGDVDENCENDFEMESLCELSIYTPRHSLLNSYYKYNTFSQTKNVKIQYGQCMDAVNRHAQTMTLEIPTSNKHRTSR